MIFTVDNIEDLKRICTNINSILNEHCDGDLMLSQKLMLGEGIIQFVNNAIVKNSGILTKENITDTPRKKFLLVSSCMLFYVL